jgi:hypothetical protein
MLIEKKLGFLPILQKEFTPRRKDAKKMPGNFSATGCADPSLRLCALA